jgi:DHA2 family multidrug resistance protein-like MFS transporter
MDPNATAGSEPRAGRREYLGLAVLALPTIVLALDMSVLYLAQPHLAEDLGATSVQQLWISDIYGFVVAGFLIMMGALGDRIGRRKLLLIGGAVFGVVSVFAAFSGDPVMLILMRGLLGVAGATLMPSTMTLLRSLFPDMKQYTKAIGIWMGCFMGGVALGPVVGGVLLQFFWWGSVFLIAVPVMALLLIFGPKLLPEYKNPDAGKLDFASAVLSLLTVLPVIFGLKELVRNGLGVVEIVAIVAGIVFGVLFVQRQRHLESPMLDLTLFRNKTFSVALTMTIFGGLMAGTNFFVYQYLQTVEGLEPLYAALWLLPSTLVIVISTQIGPLVAQRVRPGYTIAGGMVLVAAGYLMLTQLDGDGGLGLLIAGLVVSGIGIGPMGSLGAGMAMSAVPMEKMGNAASVNQISGDFGIAMGVALMGTIGTVAYQTTIDIPPGLPADAANLVGESVANAYHAASGLSQDVAGQVILSANDALATALNIAAIGSAVLAVILMVLSSTMLRHVPPTGQAASPDAAPDAADAPEAGATADGTPAAGDVKEASGDTDATAASDTTADTARQV